MDSFDRHDSPVAVVTTINHPTKSLEAVVNLARAEKVKVIVIGDAKSPEVFAIPGARYYSIEAQNSLGFSYPGLCPTGTYARKNVGYLLAFAQNPRHIIETDDDNRPLSAAFMRPLPINGSYNTVAQQPWHNVYQNFSDGAVWPRGFPLQFLQDKTPARTSFQELTVPIQQGLADGDPDVDAIYRMTGALPISFNDSPPIALEQGTWCPFNSQNTIFYPQAYLLTYLPAHCSFRMTDIWRGLVAQRIIWENGWNLVFRSSTVYQDRNEHNLLKDFEDEIPGYVGNDEIRRVLENLQLKKGVDAIADNLRTCYNALCLGGFIGAAEPPLLEAWLSDALEALS